jgi:TPR repeat protein
MPVPGRICGARCWAVFFFASFVHQSIRAADESDGRLGAYCYPLAPAELKGSAIAQDQLGKMYENGVGVP